MSDRQWCWIAAIASIVALAVTPSGWIGLVALILVWTLVVSDEKPK